MHTGTFDTPEAPTAAASPISSPAAAKASSQRRWSTKGDMWSFGLSLWSIAEGAQPFAHLLDDEVLIAAAGGCVRQSRLFVCVWRGVAWRGNRCEHARDDD